MQHNYWPIQCSINGTFLNILESKAWAQLVRRIRKLILYEQRRHVENKRFLSTTLTRRGTRRRNKKRPARTKNKLKYSTHFLTLWASQTINMFSWFFPGSFNQPIYRQERNSPNILFDSFENPLECHVSVFVEQSNSCFSLFVSLPFARDNLCPQIIILLSSLSSKMKTNIKTISFYVWLSD